MSRLLTPAFFLVSVVVFLGALAPNLFFLTSEFLAQQGFDEQQIGFITGAFTIGSLPTMQIVGWLMARISPRLVLTAGCLVVGLGCIAFDLASGALGFAAARLIQGSGFAAVLVGGGLYVAEIAPEGRLAQALGVAGVLTLTSQAIGPALAELLVAEAGWEQMFRAGAMAGAAGATVATFLPRSRAPRRRESTAGGALGATRTIAATCLAGIGFGSVMHYIADYGEQAGVSRVTPFFTSYVVAAISARLGFGHMSDRHGRRAVAVPALLIHAAALVLFSYLASVWHMIASGAMYGLAHGLYYPTLQAHIVDQAPAGARSRAIAAANTAFGVGIFISAYALGSIASNLGYPTMYRASAGCGLVAAALVAFRR